MRDMCCQVDMEPVNVAHEQGILRTHTLARHLGQLIINAPQDEWQHLHHVAVLLGLSMHMVREESTVTPWQVEVFSALHVTNALVHLVQEEEEEETRAFSPGRKNSVQHRYDGRMLKATKICELTSYQPEMAHACS